MNIEQNVLNRLAPALHWEPDWEGVLERAGETHRRRLPLFARRRVTLAIALAAVVVVPLVAVAASSNDWWFLKHATKATTPTSAPIVVKDGAFGKKQWALVAYPAPDGLCFSLTFTAKSANGGGSANECGPIVGFPSTQHPGPQLAITYLLSGGSSTFPSWITGPVVPSAATVRIHIAARTITTSTFAAPSSLGRIRFYAVALPRDVLPSLRGKPGTPPLPPVHWVAAYDSRGRIIACLNPRKSNDGLSALSACR